MSLDKEIATFLGAFLPKFANNETNNPSDWIKFDNLKFRYLSFTKFYICWHIISNDISYFSLVSFLIFCLVVRNNSCSNYSSSSFSCFIFAADITLFNCILLVLFLLLDSLSSFIILLHVLEKILVSLIFSKIEKTNIDWSLPSSAALPSSSSFLIVQLILFAEVLLSQHLNLFVCLNQ